MKDDTLMLLRLGLKLGAIDHRALERCIQALEQAPADDVPPTQRLMHAGIIAEGSLVALWSEDQLRGHVAFGQLDTAQADAVRGLREAHNSYVEDEDDLSPIDIGPDLEPTMEQDNLRSLASAAPPAKAPTPTHGFVPDPRSDQSGEISTLGPSLYKPAAKDDVPEAGDEVTLFFDAPMAAPTAAKSPSVSPPRAPTPPPPAPAEDDGADDDESTLFFDAPMERAAPKAMPKAPAVASPTAPPVHVEGDAAGDEATLFFDAPMARAAPKPPAAKPPAAKPPAAKPPAAKPPAAKPPAMASSAGPPVHVEGNAAEDEATLFFDSPFLPGALKPARPAPPAEDSDGDLSPIAEDDVESAATVIADDDTMARLMGRPPEPASAPLADLGDDDTLAPISTDDVENAATMVADEDSIRRLVGTIQTPATAPVANHDDDTLAPIKTDDVENAATMVADEDSIRRLVGTFQTPSSAPVPNSAVEDTHRKRGQAAQPEYDPLEDTEDSIPAISSDDLEGTVRRPAGVMDSGEDDAEVATILSDSEADDDDAMEAIAFSPPPREPTFNDEAPTFLSLKPDAARAASVPPEPTPRGLTSPVTKPVAFAPSAKAPPAPPAKAAASGPPTAAPITKPAAPASRTPAAAFAPPPPASRTPAAPFVPPPPASTTPAAPPAPPGPTFRPASATQARGGSTSNPPTAVPQGRVAPSAPHGPAGSRSPSGGRLGRVFSALFLVALCASVAALYQVIMENRRLAAELEETPEAPPDGPRPDGPGKVVPPKVAALPSDALSAVLALAESIGPPPEGDRVAKAFELDLRLFHWAIEWSAHERSSELLVLERQARHLALAWSEYRQALAVLDTARTRKLSLSPEARWLEVFLLDRLGDRDAASKALAELSAQAGEWATLAKAETARAAGEVAKATEGYRGATDAIAQLQRSRMLRHAGQAKAAAADLDALIAAHPRFAAAKVERAFARLDQDDPAPARELVAGGAATPNDPHAEILAARIDIASGASGKALAQLTRIVREHAGIGEAHAALALALAREGRTAESDAERDRAAELEPARKK